MKCSNCGTQMDHVGNYISDGYSYASYSCPKCHDVKRDKVGKVDYPNSKKR